MMEVELVLLQNMKVASTDQNSILAFDNKILPLYYDILTRKNHELDLDIYIRNVKLYVSFKMV